MVKRIMKRDRCFIGSITGTDSEIQVDNGHENERQFPSYIPDVVPGAGL